MSMTAAATEFRTFADADSLAHEVADWLRGRAQASDQPFAVCLSGGSTPRRLYECLASPDIASRFPWDRVHWFWGDERFVPHDHPDSNYRMVREALLSRAPVPDENIHAVPTEGISPQEAAAAYEATLKRFYGRDTLTPDRPLFGVTLLGVGADGHTASLFPGQPALRERQRWAVAVIGAKSEVRITLTYPTLDSSRDLAFVVTGAEKRQARGARSGRRPGGPCRRHSPGWMPALVHGSRCGAGTDQIMSMRSVPAGKDLSPSPMALIVMGVSGSGKSTIGTLLAMRLHWEYEDADWFHPAANIEKMHNGIPLTDADRLPWLHSVAAWIDQTRREAGTASLPARRSSAAIAIF